PARAAELDAISNIERGNVDTLHAAIAAAGAQLAVLLHRVQADEAEIVKMQMAFLEDDELVRPAFEAIAAGSAVADAWSAALDAEIASYQASDDEYFRARAIDFKDIKDRVLSILRGEDSGSLSVPEGMIFLAPDLRPSEFLSARWGAGTGIALLQGSPTSHVAMLARGRGIPMVVGLGPDVHAFAGTALLDGVSGTLVANPVQKRIDAARAQQADDTVLRAAMIAQAAKP